MSNTRRLDTPALPPLIAVPLAIVFVVLRWLDAAHHHLGAFVLAGSKYASRARVPKGLPIRAGSGYDGQFYYRLALNPFNLARASYGIRLDTMSRVERIGYPFLAWVLAWGHHSAVPLTLVAVNVLAAGVLGYAGGLLARSAGRHTAWGLVFPLYWGYLWTLGRDLSELTTAALVVMGLVALIRNRPVWAGLAFLGAVVSKETALLLVGTLALSAAWVRWTGRSTGTLAINAAPPASPTHTTAPTTVITRLTLRPSDVAYIIPLGGFVGWQALLLADTGKLPIAQSGSANLGVPFLGLAHGIAHYVNLFPSVASALWIGEFCLMGLLIATVVRCRRDAPFELQVLWAVSVILGFCAATGIWLGDVGFRSLDDVYLLSWVVLLFARPTLWPRVALCGAAWCLVAIELIRYI